MDIKLIGSWGFNLKIINLWVDENFGVSGIKGLFILLNLKIILKGVIYEKKQEI